MGWGTNTMACPFPYIFISGDTSGLQFMLKQSVIARSCNNEADRICDDWLVRHQEFFRESEAISVQACKILRWSSSWTLNIFFIRQELVTRKQCCRSRIFLKRFSCTVCRFTFCRFGCSYFVHPVRAPELLIPATSPFEVDIADAELKGYWSNPTNIFFQAEMKHYFLWSSGLLF
jgi:hypothetical protein